MKVTFKPSGLIYEARPGMSIMDAIRFNDLKLDAPCGGNGTCKKCKVMVTDEKGTREVLACMTKITGDITVDISRKDEGHRILMGGITRDVAPTPAVKVYTLEIPKPSTADLRDSWRRLTDTLSAAAAVPADYFRPNLRVISKLYNTLEENKYRVDAVVCADEILDVVSVGSPVLGLAYDIGTTTVACYFVDMRSGEQIAQSSLLNPQTTYGGDVIMRVKYCVENGVDGPTGDIRKALNQLAAKCAASAKQKMKNIYLITVVGNTCMHHLFLGISPASLAYAPYTPAAAEPMQLTASEFGFAVNPSAKLYMLPNIAGFVGADTVGAALAASMDEKKEITLLIDIGTNGEMVLGTEKRLIACSTAAGPAFEGALITCGMRGAEGAIDHVSLKDGKFAYSVIGGGKPIGICGSGLIDLMSELVRTGLVESAGRLLPPDEIDTEEGKLLADYIIEYEGQRAFLLADGDASGTGEALVFTQKDIREVQLAKGAMAAGIQMMCQRLGIVTDDIKTVMIAGAFGSYMSPASACGIGLIPPELEEEVMAIGNAAGQGAKLCVLSIDEYKRAADISKKIEYLELAADPAFQDVFVDELEFPGEE
jgi:uncharacterized 2Fe-2S/4Fe-4S cluster protein (DUF4445 family)